MTNTGLKSIKCRMVCWYLFLFINQSFHLSEGCPDFANLDGVTHISPNTNYLKTIVELINKATDGG